MDRVVFAEIIGWMLFSHVAWEESRCPLFLRVNLSVCLFLCPMPQGRFEYSGQRSEKHTSSSPLLLLHMVLSVPQALNSYARVQEKKACN